MLVRSPRQVNETDARLSRAGIPALELCPNSVYTNSSSFSAFLSHSLHLLPKQNTATQYATHFKILCA